MQMKKRISRAASDKLKLEALKEALRAEGVVTNVAIQQYLLQHHGPFEKRKKIILKMIIVDYLQLCY